MTSPYRAVFRTPGAKAFSAAGLIGRMPLSMLGIGIVTMISQVTGRYGLAGALTATLALSGAVCGPQVSRLVDRYGQARVLRPVTAVTVASVAGLLVCVRAGAPDWAYFACVICAGLTPSMGAMVRARWSEIHRGSPEMLHTAYSLESVVDEIVFIVGPITSIGLCTVWFPEAGPLLAAVFLGTGVLLLTAQRATEPTPVPHAHLNGGSALRTPGLPVLCGVFVGVGTVFGAVDVTTVAFADERGHKALASLVLATYALGSCLAGLVFGLVKPGGTIAGRFRLGIGLMAVSMIPPLLVGSLPFLALALFFSGLTIAPTMVNAMGLVEQLVPRGRLTEGITWTSTGLAVGVAAGAALAGRVIDAHGASAAFWVCTTAATCAAAVAFLGYGRLLPAPDREELDDDEPDRSSVHGVGRHDGCREGEGVA
ncbi:Predicted arabinose efflux permease, MFS family [Actinacidiphila yanglinensis]|uniref:Predicted arabinose efflux permease, MFS family n=1 Tax=Actinacidiphila yanglinensis TaxID=310779 RepID=A0A1H5X639_9ACTN|nr:MFS transporter [Actinacidiphila yanglinensis]SEG06925.1 Predicted arabinose efflux permease, MFS family [Actinacidiphila yanglinensis]